ncbi:MAG: DUF2238 domain-containing protein [Clostridia bacterium]|nr:DUF2238 domain-containing protein [Clostridia bacterium]
MLKQVKEFYKEESKTTLTIYLVLRFLVIICMVLEALKGNWNNVFLCVLTLILYLIPYLVDKKLNIDLPHTMDIMIFLFIFSAEILGEIQNFYGTIKHWDTILHTINGFLCAAIGFALIDILNRSKKVHIDLSPIFVAVVAFCFSMTVGVLWEFFEFGADSFLKTDMQKDRIVENFSSVSLHPEGKNIPVILNNIDKTVIYSHNSNGNSIETTIQNGYLDIGIIDTMKDLLVNFIGAIVFSILGFLYIKNRDEYKFARNFIPKVKD